MAFCHCFGSIRSSWKESEEKQKLREKEKDTARVSRERIVSGSAGQSPEWKKEKKNNHK